MNRRQFLKVLTGALASLPLAAFGLAEAAKTDAVADFLGASECPPAPEQAGTTDRHDYVRVWLDGKELKGVKSVTTSMSAGYDVTPIGSSSPVILGGKRTTTIELVELVDL